jgi:aryl-alcohol dehydrogenase-like predicted oxidoreductase
MLAGRAVSPIGLGCMSLSHAYGHPPGAEQGARVLQRALDLGVDHFDTARLYGGGRNEDLIGKAIGHRRDEYLLASKMGIFVDGDKRGVDCRPATIRAEIEKSLTALRTDRIDLFYLHRRDFTVPIEESVGALAGLVAEGKIGGIGLSEMSAQTLRAAHAEHPIAAMQTEYSPWTRNVEIAVLEATRELEVALVAFSPLGRGALCGTLRDPADLPASDLRGSMPRFSAENWPANRALIDDFAVLAREQGVTPAQLSLGWVLARGSHVHVIPGTARIDHLEEDVARADWLPDADTVARVDALINQSTVAGHRYPPALRRSIDTEDFAAAE